MNEKKKGLIIAISLAVVILLMIIIGVTGGKKGEKIYQKFEEALTKESNTLIYIGRPTCGYCSLMQPNLDDMTKRYKFNYLYVNTDDLSSNYLNQIISKLGIEKVTTPYLAVVSNKGVVAKQEGFTDYDKTFEFLQKNNIIGKEEKLLLNYIDFDQYKTLIAEDKANVIVIGQSTCGYCIQAKLILNQIAEEEKVTINYLNVSYLTEEQGKEFEKSFEYFSKEWGTPILFISKQGKMLDIKEQLGTKEEYKEILKKQGIL
ncbi:MAG: thioredoxin family protein [Bacilli bacterium]